MINVDGIVSTIAGRYRESGLVDGEGDTARFRSIWGVLVDASDNIYVTNVDKYAAGVFSTSSILANWTKEKNFIPLLLLYFVQLVLWASALSASQEHEYIAIVEIIDHLLPTCA